MDFSALIINSIQTMEKENFISPQSQQKFPVKVPGRKI
jgi:hypothetical protein